MENQNRFDPLANGSGTKASQTGSDKNKFISGLKFVSININSIRGKKLELLAFLDFHQPQIVAIQETKIDSSISTSELFPESCPYNVYRKDRTLDGGGVMLLIHKDVSHMPITGLENDSESVWVKVFANKTSHFVASWYRPPGGDSEKLKSSRWGSLSHHYMVLKAFSLGYFAIKFDLLLICAPTWHWHLGILRKLHTKHWFSSMQLLFGIPIMTLR